ncbi:MAG TPA: thiamine pyrophosphate-dependent enzyme [Candidatus Limnocylindrales bacterium]|nr:thiamine pyrophosphate-dependent enzyme [Candidatus Limnocylindrales bacterium]
MRTVFEKPATLADKPTHYCPGCTHGIAHRLVAEVLEKLNVCDRVVGVASVGCSVLAYDYFDYDMIQAAHGRATAVATGVKRARPDCVVFTYQGDGDLAAIGLAETIHAAARGENITVIFINNAIFGMTGGQMAPTTMLGQKTSTTTAGRESQREGFPLRMCEMLMTVRGVAYLARVPLTNPGNVARARTAIRRAFQAQIEGKGFALVELLSTCPNGWGLTPRKALRWVDEVMADYYPPGEFCVEPGDPDGGRAGRPVSWS